MLNCRYRCLFVIIIFCCLVSVSVATEEPASSVIPEVVLVACPDSPNCVSSDARDDKHRIAPLTFSIPAEEAWRLLKEQVAKLPRTVIVADKPGYLHVECRSALFGFVDDLEFHLRVRQGLIAVRSAARTGYYDFGANRQRVEDLRTSLRLAGFSQ